MLRLGFKSIRPLRFHSLHEFDAVAEWINDVDAAEAGKIGIGLRRKTGRLAACNDSVEIFHDESRMRFLRGVKIFFDPGVDLDVAGFEPTAAAICEGCWLGHFFKAKNSRIKATRRILRAGRDGQLDVIEPKDFDERGISPWSVSQGK